MHYLKIYKMTESPSSQETLDIIPFDQEVSTLDAVAILGEALNKSDQEIYELFPGLKETVEVAYAVNGIVVKFSKTNMKYALGDESADFSFAFEIINKNLPSNEYERVFDKTFDGTGAIQSATYLQLTNGETQISSQGF